MMLNGLLNKILAVVGRRRLDAELDDEIRAHLEMAEEQYLSRGMSPEEARRAARRDFGGVARVKERHRDVRAFGWLENVLRDLKFGARGLRKRPGFALTVFVALALGIGLPALTFGLIRSALLTQLPFDGADRIMRVDRTGEAPVTDVDYANWTARQRSFESLGAVRQTQVSLGIEDRGTEPVSGAAMTPSVLSLLSVQPALGRAFTEADAAPGAPPVVLLGHTVWRDRMDSDPAVLGSEVRVNGSQAQVLGIMPEGFGFPSNEQMWSPLAIDPLRGDGDGTGAADERVSVVGLLREGVSPRAAAAELTALTFELDAGDGAPTRPSSQVSVRNFTDIFNAPGASAGLAALMLGAALMVLLVACANVANVLLAGTVARRREVAVRVAIGASRLRIASQLWAEVLLLAAAGAAGGVGIALVVIRFIDGLLPPGMPFWVDFSLDPWVLAFVAFVAVLAALLAGMVPAMQVARANTQDVLKDDARGSSSFRLGRVMRRLIAVELAL